MEDLIQIDFTEDGKLIALVNMEDGEYILKVKDELPEVLEKQEIIVTCEYRDMILEGMITKFNRSNDYYHITMKCMDDITETEDFCTELQLQLAKGEGPDIIVSNVVQEPENWVRLGYFDKLDDIIEHPESYLNSALLSGQVDGVQYGIPFDFHLKMVAYPESFGEDELTFEALMEKACKENAKILECNLSGCDIIFEYCLQDMENKTYIDWENGISHLNEEAFLEALKFAKEYQDNSEYDDELVSDYLEEGKVIAISQEMDEVQDYWFF